MSSQGQVMFSYGATAAAAGVAFDPSAKGANITLSNSNFTAAISGAGKQGSVFLATNKSSGKWYFEFTITFSGSANGYYWYNGVELNNTSTSILFGDTASSWAAGRDTGTNVKAHSGSGSVYGATLTTTQVQMIAMDLDNKFFYTGVQGTWNSSGDPTSGASGTGATYGSVNGTPMYFGASMGVQGAGTDISITVNNGATTVYTVPSGYSVLT